MYFDPSIGACDITDDDLHAALSALEGRERSIICHRIGLSGPALTLRDTGAIHSISPSRAQQVQNIALCKMRRFLFNRLQGEENNRLTLPKSVSR